MIMKTDLSVAGRELSLFILVAGSTCAGVNSGMSISKSAGMSSCSAGSSKMF
jgi:hypothetical protein